MDTGEGKMIPVDHDIKEFLKKHNRSEESLFKVGEVLEIKRSRFRINKITKKGLVLRVLPDKRKI